MSIQAIQDSFFKTVEIALNKNTDRLSHIQFYKDISTLKDYNGRQIERKVGYFSYLSS